MSDSVQQIKDRLSIIDVISPFVELVRAGKNYKGKSPFTTEKTPSFYVSPDRGMYYCFSTSQGGDMFSFVQAMEGVEFKEALKILAQKAGVELVPEDPKKKTERERWYGALSDATSFYVDSLTKEPAALEYLNNRGVSPVTIQKWQIGFAPGPPKAGWRVVKEFLEGKSYTKEELHKVGLIKTAEGGKEPFDVFRDRIMFPMSDQNGKVVAFSGRILHPDEKSPKYVNSPETELYKKSELLFGYDKAKHGIRNLNFSLIVEGQFDVVMAHQAGYHNTVAVSGTALTLHHVQLLERLSDRVVLALDADRAGIAAMKRAAELMLKRGIDVKVAELPRGKDPADIIKENVNEFKKIVGQSVHVIEFLLHVIRRENENDRTFKLATQKEVYPYVLLLASRVDQYSFAEMIAKKTSLPVDVVWFEIEQLRQKQDSSPRSDYEDTLSQLTKDDSQTDNATRLLYSQRIYLLAAASIKTELKKYIDSQLEELGSLLEMTAPDKSSLAKTTIELEDIFANRKDMEIYEEIARRMNILRREVANTKLSRLRLEDANFLDSHEGLEIAKLCQTMKREDIYSAELLNRVKG